MNWSNLYVIFRREVRDQIRDRRTLFMIFVLPLLLYPMLVYGVLKVVAAMEQKPRTVVVVGAEHLPKGASPLLNPDGLRFNPTLFDSPAESELLVVHREPDAPPWNDPQGAERAVRGGLASAVMLIPANVSQQIERDGEISIPIKYNSIDEPSQITHLRLKEMLDRWRKSILASRLKRDQKTESYAEPITVKSEDVATAGEVGSNVWSRLFPFLLVMMSLTGAFYPAVDLCAGEKERGTMETLLISPASRGEIVGGKFLTIMLASVVTALLNLLSMGLTGIHLASSLGAVAPAPGRRPAISALAPPTFQAAFWMILLLIPLAAFFSAICLALSVLARSMKEGQYYMTPLYLVCIPLVFLTLAPEIELNLFISLLPITGVALLLKALILGRYDVALRFFLPVLIPTLVYAAVALRWAVDQFQREDVLFREAEHFSLSSWLRHLVRDREPIPSGGQATLCFALILSVTWFLLQYLPSVGERTDLLSVVAGQAVVLIVPVGMALVLTSSPGRTLRLTRTEPRFLGLAVGLVIALNPLINELAPVVEWLFPISNVIKEALSKIMVQASSPLVAVVIFALIPAICEEFAFRGFILSALERQHRTRSAILLSALMFGFLHVLLSLFQQLFNATLLGIVLGLIAIRSRSILPCIVFHFLNNASAVLLGFMVSSARARPILEWIYRNPGEGLYHGAWIALSAVVSPLLLYSLWSAKGHRAKTVTPGRTGAVEPTY
jgi:sodium transport system permease protein